MSSLSKAAGYFNKTIKNKDCFRATLKLDVGNDNKVDYLRTEDFGFLNHDELFLCRRSKDLIILGGCNHYPQDFESTTKELLS